MANSYFKSINKKVLFQNKIVLIVLAVLALMVAANSADAAVGYLKIIVETTGPDKTFKYYIKGGSMVPTNLLNNGTTSFDLDITTVDGKGVSDLIALEVANPRQKSIYSIIQSIKLEEHFYYPSCDQTQFSFVAESDGLGGSYYGFSKTTISVSADEFITCTFYNHDQGVTLSEETGTKGYLDLSLVGGPGILNFSITGSQSTTVSVAAISQVDPNFAGAIAGQRRIALDPGTYTVEATIPDGWSSFSPPSATCQPEIRNTKIENTPQLNGLENVIILPGKITSCTFVTTPSANLWRPEANGQSGTLVLEQRVYESYYERILLPYYNTMSLSYGVYNHNSGRPANETSLRILTIGPIYFHNDSWYQGETFSTSINLDPGSYEVVFRSVPVPGSLHPSFLNDTISCDKPYTTTGYGAKDIVIEPGKTTICTFAGRFVSIHRSSIPNLTADGTVTIVDNIGGLYYHMYNGYYLYDGPATPGNTGVGRCFRDVISNDSVPVSSRDFGGCGEWNVGFARIHTQPQYGYKLDAVSCDRAFVYENGIVTELEVLPGQTTICTFTWSSD